MYHSIYIGDKNTWDDFHLVSTDRPTVVPPEVRTVYVDAYGIDGPLDLSTALTGGILYKNRVGSWTFTAVNSMYGVTDESWEIRYHKLANYLHGKKFKIVLEDDPNYYYMGRLSIDEWKSGKNWSSVTINYTLEPYKYEKFSSLDDWLWDPFSFETGIVREYKNIAVNGSYTLTIAGSERPVIPQFTVSAGGNGMNVRYNGVTYTIPDGSSRNPNIVLREEESTLVIQGTGTISILYQGGWI